MEVKTLKTFELNADGFKVTPKFLEAIGMDSKNYPTFPQALKAKKDANIAFMTDSPYYEKSVQFALQSIREISSGEYIENLIFNYGYILGIRAERARRKGVK